MADQWTAPSRKQDVAGRKFSVERSCSAVKVKIEKLEDEEKEKMSFYPKGDSNLIHYLCIHDLTSLATEQGWKLILERMDQKLVAKLLIKKEVPIENCRDKVREIIVKALPNLHQESCCLSSLGNKDLSNKGQDHVDRSNQSLGLGNNKPSNGDQAINDPLQKALACLVPLISAGKNQAGVLYDKNSNCVIITGPTETVKYLHKEAKIKLYSVTMETVLASPSHGYLLRRLRVMDQLTGQYPGLTVVIQDCNTRVTWTGTEENIRRGQQEVEKFIKEVKTDTFHVSMVMKKLLLTPEMKNYIDNALQKENITCVWQVTETGQVQVWSMDVLSSKRAGHKIRENCREETFFVKDFPLILEISKVGFGFGITEVNHFAVEETSDTVHVAAKSDTMQKIIQYLQDLEEQQTLGKEPSVKQGGDNSEKTTSGCTIQVRGMNKQTSNDTVELYFESRRAVGRSVDIEKFDDSKREKDGVIFITYENEEDAQLVLGRQHTLDKCPLTVRLCKPLEPVPGPSFYQEKVFFRNMNPNTTRKTLENFLKSNVSVTPIEFLYGKDEGAALVTFDGAVDFEELMNACQNSTLENCLLEAKRVPVSRSVSVSGVGKKTSLDTLECYFENTRRSGGSDVTEVQEISEGNLIVTFEDAEAIDKVCQRTHKVDGKTLTVQIYHELLGHRVSRTGPTFKVPSPLVIKEADKDKFQQLLSTDVTKLEKQLGDHHAKLHWPGDIPGDLRLECLLTQEVEDSNRLVVSWEEVVRDILRKFLAQAGTTKAQVAVTSPVGSTNKSSAKEDSDLNKVDTIRVDDSRGHLSSSQDGFEHVPRINIEMPEETFLALQYFCRGEGSFDQKAVHYRDSMLQISCNEGKDKKDIEVCIESKLKHIEVLNKDEVSFTPVEEPKVKGTIEQINMAVDGVYCYQLEKDEHSMVHLMAQSYSQLQTAKHKISLGLGRIKQTETLRNRRFDNTPLQQNKGDSTPTDRHSFSQTSTTSRSSWTSQSTAGYGSVGPKDFTTPEGLLVRVYPGSILHLDVDCIVNAANGDLQHGGGVAYVISNAAGYDFERDSRDYIARYGPLRVGEVCTTSAGNLKYKGVIHAVGPRWYDYREDEKLTCLDDLKLAVKNSLDEADIQKYQSIAIPAISSGIFGVPKEYCTQQYYRAVVEYIRSRGLHSTLTEVHFIDKDTQMCELIRMTFSKCFGMNSMMALGLVGSLQTRNKFSASSYPLKQSNNVPLEKDQRARSLSSEDGSSMNNLERFPYPTGQNKVQNKTLGRSTDSKFCYQIGNHLTVNLVCGNIIEADTDAIVNPENEKLDGRGNISREIRKVAGEKYINEFQHQQLQTRNHEMTKVFNTLAGDSKWKFVVHVVAPRWDSIAVKYPNKYEKNLKQSYENILVEMDRLKLDSLAMPVLGTGDYTHTTPYAMIARTMVSVCKQFAVRIRNRKEVCVYCTDKTLLTPIKDDFDKEFCEDESLEDGQKNLTEPGYTDHDYHSKDKHLPLEVTEDCCICIDTMTRPKKLLCGHVFCTECIDQQFKYKPACPQCGAVHGKITGDQPPGTMTMTTTKSYWGGGGSLPGYEGCGIINISYHFPSGKQGPNHPTPGKHYQGITRPGFLPDNEKGRLVAKLLRIAFDRKLVFTIGRSLTTGQDGVVTWNSIHHKTRMNGDPQAYGYPDPSYLDMVLYDLKTKGITEDSLRDP